MRPLDTHPAAKSEVQQAFQRYRKERIELANTFLDAFLEGIDAIEADSETGHIYDDRHRFVLLRRFPYVIYFRSEATATLVVAVAHVSQKPDYWIDRR